LAGWVGVKVKGEIRDWRDLECMGIFLIFCSEFQRFFLEFSTNFY
jgi:hypothetical protein